MNSVTLSSFAAICLISSAFGTECSSGPGYRFPIACPGLLDPSKSYCCEIGGSFRCCDEEEFARQDQEPTDNTEAAPAPRHKRDSPDAHEAAKAIAGGFISIILTVVFSVPSCILCCCFCCPGCPGYYLCHPNATNITIVQPAGYPADDMSQNSFGHSALSQPATRQDPPPKYDHIAAPSM